MKKIFNPGLVGLVTLIALYSSCAKDTSSPSSDNRSKFLGTWNVTETYNKAGSPGWLMPLLTYQVTVTADPDSSTAVFISNFANAGANVKAHAETSGNNIYISPAKQVLSTGWKVDGSGTITGTTPINWIYTIDNGADIFYATAVYSK
ncbi:MAG TPA: hypothetical protein VMC08_00510 [Bacteroidales bacterium]|nr:hypothetical protein [Bacteroidales bacterium]